LLVRYRRERDSIVTIGVDLDYGVFAVLQELDDKE